MKLDMLDTERREVGMDRGGFTACDDGIDLTDEVMSEVRRTCGHLPSTVQSEVYAERLFEAGYNDNILE